MDINLVDDASTEPIYQRMRGAAAKQFSITEVSGIGQGAYLYDDPQLGPHLATYDGNLNLEISLIPRGGTVPDATTLLTQVATGTLAKLRA
ncbi:hypothetical protein EV385_0437 [Krasilnikovia cinnamomea]|uniref:Uncharacterized protein n=1 Tax=Krasilnikovia cinnamomea TaxID=349313 RepID=A0A4Q7ZFF1_9ACTN|nr:hypothetical protein [Krasilnikovia cinnamomea]RZU48719.1 hypothetical protein EV385_0437 [Krasilnikovia cinnamomea]